MSDLTCEEAELYISLSPDGELSPEEQASLDCHVAACPRCRRSLENVTSLEWLVRTSLRTPDDTLTSNVRAAVRADARQRRQSRLVRRASAAAAALLVAAGLTIAGRSVMQRNFFSGDKTNAPERTFTADEEATSPTGIDIGKSDHTAPGDKAGTTGIDIGQSDPAVPGDMADSDEKVADRKTGSLTTVQANCVVTGDMTGETVPSSASSPFSWETVLGILLAAVGAVCLALLI